MLGVLRGNLRKVTTRQNRWLPLTPKHGNKHYFKGKGGRKEGHHTSRGNYVLHQEFLLDLIVPDLAGCPLKPYVEKSTQAIKVPPPAPLAK